MRNVILYILTMLLFTSCFNSEEKDPLSSGLSAGYTNTSDIEWQSSAFIYGNSPIKKNLSILYFTDDTCSFGFQLEEETFTNSEVIRAMNESYNCAAYNTMSDTMIQFYDSSMTGNQLFKLYNLVGVPSFLILDKENNYVGRIRGYYPPDEFIEQLNIFR